MPKNNTTISRASSHTRRSPLSDIASDSNRTNTSSDASENAQTLWHRALLAEARGDTSQDNQPSQFAGPHKHRGKGFPLRYWMELVEIYRHFRQKKDVKINSNNFHKFVKADIHPESIKQWDKGYDKIKFDVLHGRGNKCTLSKDPSMLVRYSVDRAVHNWLVEVRKENGIISGRQLQATAETIFHVLVDDIAPGGISFGRPISFTASWRTQMREEYCIASLDLKGEAGGVDKQAIEPRMAKIRTICSEYDPDDTYNCDEAGMYLLEVPGHSYNTPEFSKGTKVTRGTGSHVSILFCINATGSSLTREKNIPALRHLVISEHLARSIKPCKNVPITLIRHGNGCMTHDLFMDWLHALDDSLSKPSLLLFDSCGSYKRIPDIDRLTGIGWTHLRLERLPANSTSVTQPLDAGVISVFKRRYVEMLTNQAIVNRYASGKKVTNGEAWSLIPYAWSWVKASTLRHCFRTTKVLPKAMADSLEERSGDMQERQPEYPPEIETTAQQQRNRHFLRLIASTLDGHKFNFTLAKNQKDAQDLAEEIRKAVCERLAERAAQFAPRERSSSIEPDDLNSFEALDGVTTKVKGLLASNDPMIRQEARVIVRTLISSKNKI